MLLKTDEVSILEKIKNLLIKEDGSIDSGTVDYDMIDKRRSSHLSDESASYSWEEVKEKVRTANL